MAQKEKLNAAKKFGSRYGRTVRNKFSRIDAQQKKIYSCPYCSYVKVKRSNTGIWECGKCTAKFASKAYMIPKNYTKFVTKIEIAE